MKGISCSWFEDHLDEYLAEELTVEQEAMVRVHLAVCDSCAESLRLWSGLETAAKRAEIRPLPPLIERRLVSGNVPEPVESEHRGSRRPVVIALSAAVAAAAAIALVLLLPDTVTESPDRDRPQPVAETFPRLVDQPGDGGAVLGGAPEMARGERRVIPVSPGTALWLGDDARVSVEALDETQARFSIEKGFAVAEIGPVDPGFRFVVQTPDGEVEARGTVFSVQVGSSGRTKVRVAEGQVEIRRKHRAAEARVLSAGHETDTTTDAEVAASAEAIAADMAFVYGPIEQPTVAEQAGPEANVTAGTPVATKSSKHDVEIAAASPEPSASAKATAGSSTSKTKEPEPMADALDQLEDESGHTPESMVKLAQAYRSRRMFSAAARTYERLVAKFPGSPSAANALVALGQLELTSLGKPSAALGHFDAYLDRSPSGALAAEARAGRARSLARLGRVGQLKAAARDYLDAHPGGRAAAEMHRRLGDAHAKTGNCQAAIAAYQTVIDRWPASPEARRARAGLDSCADVP